MTKKEKQKLEDIFQEIEELAMHDPKKQREDIYELVKQGLKVTRLIK